MSVKVDLDRLGETMGGYDFAYLLTVSDDARAHAVAVQPRLAGGALHVAGLGNRTRTNLAARTAVTLLFPPREQGGYSLIVDGAATTQDDGASVVPSHAVLHRPADHPTTAPDGSGESCGNDCVPLEG